MTQNSQSIWRPDYNLCVVFTKMCGRKPFFLAIQLALHRVFQKCIDKGSDRLLCLAGFNQGKYVIFRAENRV